MKYLILIFCFSLVGGSVAAQENTEQPFIYNSNDKRDPFMPLVTSSGVLINTSRQYYLGDLTLEGVFLDSSGNLAVINGVVLQVGEKIGDFSIKEINNDNVILLKGAQASVLRLKKEE